jgi:hypothetical protein
MMARHWHKAAVDRTSALGREPTKLRCEIKSEVEGVGNGGKPTFQLPSIIGSDLTSAATHSYRFQNAYFKG